MRARGRRVMGWGLGAPPLPGLLSGFGERRRINFLNQFAALISYSRRGAEEYAALGFPREKIFTACNAVSPRPVFPLPVRASVFKDKPVILFVGRLQTRKRVPELLRACSDMQSNPRLIIVGDGPERGRLEAQAKQIYPSTEFVGVKHGDELKPCFTKADLFVLPGTGGLAVQEAMSYGLPIIVARGVGTQDCLWHAANGCR